MLAALASSVARVRPQIAIEAPAAAQSSAVARPIPRLPPVMTTMLPSRASISGRLLLALSHVAEVRFAVKPAADAVDRDDVGRRDAREVDRRAVTLDQPRRFLLRL